MARLKLSRLMKDIHKAQDSGKDVTPILIKMAELYEQETEKLLKTNPDPFNETYREASPLDVLIREAHKNDLIFKIYEYTRGENLALNTSVCRLLLAMSYLPKSSFHHHIAKEGLVLRLIEWAEKAHNPLRACATGLLAVAKRCMSYKFAAHRVHNTTLVPLMIRRLYELSKESLQDVNYFSDISSIGDGVTAEGLSSNFAGLEVGSCRVFPSTPAIEEKYILKYLASVAEYQELIEIVLNENALALILRYIDSRQNPDVRLAFQALKYLSSLLCHKKTSMEFLNTGGLEKLLEVHRSSLAANGVSICLYSLGKLKESMEMICMGTCSITSNLVDYAVWLLENSHKSSRCYAVQFLGFGFAYKVILEHFDQKDGLRKLFNVMSTLDKSSSHNGIIRKLRYRTTVKHVSESLKTYFEAHLAAIIEDKQIANYLQLDFKVSRSETPKAVKRNYHLTPEAVERNLNMIHDLSLTPLSNWKPVNEFVELDGISFLLELVSSYYDGSPSSIHGRHETIRKIFDILKICSLTISTGLKFCKKLSSPDCSRLTGIQILLQAAEGQLLPESEVQCSALLTIINCIYSKMRVIETNSQTAILTGDADPRLEELLHKIVEAIVFENGISILVNLLSDKNPFNNIDSIRAFACKALCGLTRSETVTQILGSLPLFTKGRLIYLMDDPVLQDGSHNRSEFRKYGLELVERVTSSPPVVGTKSSMNLNRVYESENLSKPVFKEDLQLMDCDHLSHTDFTTIRLPNGIEKLTRKTPIDVLHFPFFKNDFQQSASATFQRKNNSLFTDNSQIARFYSTIPSETILHNHFSKFRLQRLIDHEGRNINATCACFINNTEHHSGVVIASPSGKIKVFDINPCKKIFSKRTHYKNISHIESRKSTTLLMTCDTRRHRSTIWNLTSTVLNKMHTFRRVFHMEFGKRNIDRIIGTKCNTAVIYDVNTFSKLQSFPVDDLGNKYINNRSTFDISDELILTDGLLYDVRSGKMVHKFDKFNSNTNGVFHPNGREIISSSEIWELRTFKLLGTVDGLDQCRIIFNEPGTVIYAVKDTVNEDYFSTFDAFDYSKISTVDTKRPVYSICCDLNDKYIAAIVESSEMSGNDEPICRLYEIGRTDQVGDDSDEYFECNRSSSEEDSEDGDELRSDGEEFQEDIEEMEL